MICPQCNGEMEDGFIHTPSNEASYWMPADSQTKGLIIMAKRLEHYDGSKTYCCPQCNTLVTILSDK